MSTHNNVQIVEINEGAKVQHEQFGTKLLFGDDEMMVNCAKYQKDWPVHLDICADKNGNLVTGVGEGRYYVAQVDIPAVKYKEVEREDVPAPAAEDSPSGYHDNGIILEPLPIDMADVVLTLWSIEDLQPTEV